MPLIETVPGAPDASALSIGLKLGAAMKAGKVHAPTARAAALSEGGFPLKSELLFAGLGGLRAADRHGDLQGAVPARAIARARLAMHRASAAALARSRAGAAPRRRDWARAATACAPAQASAGMLRRRCAEPGCATPSRRSLRITRLPPDGLNVMPRRRVTSGAPPASAAHSAASAARSTSFISSSAKLAPRQRRRPPPNGIHV